MSIPIDKLYHYIEGIAREIRGDDVIIYRFNPHGSKKIEDLSTLEYYHLLRSAIQPQIYCYDQEPLDYDRYINQQHRDPNSQKILEENNVTQIDYNLCIYSFHIYDKHILVHSEQRSANLNKYTEDKYFIPVYYWSHGIIARDWFRYAEYDTFDKDIKKTFLIYNRAWSGTREYRLKFIDLLIEHGLVDECQVTVNPIEPELEIHYSNYTFTNKSWTPNHCLENYVADTTQTSSTASADYCNEDYSTTEFEVVLETLFDDDRLQLTEKILRPIACGQPFLLVSTHGSLEYLRSYGFRTFASVIDESYDTIEDPVLRLEAIVKSMKEIANWNETEKIEKMAVVNRIAEYNRKHFFSSKFTNQVVDELTVNLSNALRIVESTNTGRRFIERRKELAKIDEFKKVMLAADHANIVKILQRAREYYNKH